MLRIIRILVITMLLLTPFASQAGANKDFVVVIDPGHGGKDAGALGRRANEKTINLNVGKKLRDLLKSNMPDARVEMTRDDDRFVTLKERPNIANKRHADIFVSIHANSIDKKSPLRNSINGAAVYTLGLRRSDTNLSLAMRENEVIKLEPDYTTSYQGFDPSSAESYIAFEMMQHTNMDQSIELAEAVQNELVRTAGRKNNGVRQAPFWVLVGTTMPAILVELDFICNPAMEKFMTSESGQDKLALAIYRGIERYRKNSTKQPVVAAVSSTRTSSSAQTERKPADKTQAVADEPVAAATSDRPSSKVEKTSTADSQSTAGKKSADNSDKIIYKVQFLTSPTKLKNNNSKLKGLSPVDFYKDGGVYKYTVGEYTSQADAIARMKKIKPLFRDAFVIKTRNGKRIK